MPLLRQGITRRLVFLCIGVCALVLAGRPSRAATLWNNGAINSTLTSDNRCDGGPSLCGSSASWTIFDNFNVPNGQTWAVTSVVFDDFLINTPVSDIGQTTVSLWSGDPLSGGILVGSATVTPTLANISGTCGSTTTCVESFTASISATLSGGHTYYMGSTVDVTSGGNTERAFAAGGNTAPGGSANGLARWEQTNGNISGSAWTAGSVNNTFPGSGINEAATAFQINGTLVVPTPEPGALLLVGIALAGLYLVRQSRGARVTPAVSAAGELRPATSSPALPPSQPLG